MRAIRVIFILAVFTIPTAQITALPLNDPPLANRENCIKMTEAVSAEVDDIVDKMIKFMELLEKKYPDYVLKYVKLDISKQIESKTDDDQSSVLEVFVNDCDKSNKDSNNHKSTIKYNTDDAESMDIHNESDYSSTTTSEDIYLTKSGNSYSEPQNSYMNSNDGKIVAAESNSEIKKRSKPYRISSNWTNDKYVNGASANNPNRRVNRKYRSTSATNDTNKSTRNFESKTTSEKNTFKHIYSEFDKSSNNNNYNEPESTTNQNENFNNYYKNWSSDNMSNYETSTTSSGYNSKEGQISNNKNDNNNVENTFLDNKIYSTDRDVSSVSNNNVSNGEINSNYETSLTDDINKSSNNISRNTTTKEYQSTSEVDKVSSYKKETATIDNISAKDTKSTTSNLSDQDKTINKYETKTEEIKVINDKSQSISNVETDNEYKKSSTKSSNVVAENQGTYYNQESKNVFNDNSEQSNSNFVENQFLIYLKTIIRNEVRAVSSNADKGKTYNNNISTDGDQKYKSSTFNNNINTDGDQIFNKLMNEFNNYKNNLKSKSNDNNASTQPKFTMIEMPDNEMFDYFASKRGQDSPFLVYMQEGMPPRLWVY